MDRRLILHNSLKKIVPRVYFQPPESIRLEYPCIVYRRVSGNTIFADNEMYNFKIRYTIVLMDMNPDTIYLEKIAALPGCNYSTHYTSDGIYHDVFNVII